MCDGGRKLLKHREGIHSQRLSKVTSGVRKARWVQAVSRKEEKLITWLRGATCNKKNKPIKSFLPSFGEN
jgi:hypothetical protein